MAAAAITSGTSRRRARNSTANAAQATTSPTHSTQSGCGRQARTCGSIPNSWATVSLALVAELALLRAGAATVAVALAARFGEPRRGHPLVGFGRWAQRPGALIRLPGIIMLVPGSASLRGLMTLIQQQDMAVGQEALMAVVNIILALIAGLLFGNLILPARKNL